MRSHEVGDERNPQSVGLFPHVLVGGDLGDERRPRRAVPPIT